MTSLMSQLLIPFPHTTLLSLIYLHHLIPCPDEQPELTIVDDHPVLNEHDDSESVKDLGISEDQVSTIIEPDRVTTRSKIRDSEAVSTHKCLYVNFLFEIEPKKQIEALEEEGWIIAMQE
ncbi:hypothetical protein Tco_1266626 [Tanacetum coccineum]